MQNKTKHKLSAAQICGWIIWWLVTIVIIGVIIILFTRSADGAGASTTFQYKLIDIFFSLLYVTQQIIAFFAIKLLHKNDGYLWPIVLIVLAFLGSFLYIVPGIWGLIVNHPQKR